MANIKPKNTKPELALFKALETVGMRFTTHHDIKGKPDIAILDEKLLIFIDGEFWHGKDYPKWKYKLNPYWKRRIENNMTRDRKIRRCLRKEGWSICRFWGRDVLKNPAKYAKRVSKIIEKKGYNNPFPSK